ncbi:MULTISPECIES: Na+/H+ antiporter subunit E [unclassified Brevundimonas]|uniref:Na+/H+ antiporter subunit E n=1 Tax=unclassified Brevundimonas TaxID=2622653 RepID=UPI0025C2B879|nr:MULTISPECIES: Na+/H+ antiporter subunit E [unclassified Brevundimonas]
MRKVFQWVLPHPLLSVALFVVWLLMSTPFGNGHLTIAVIVALLVPQVMRVLEPERVRVARPLSVLRLLYRLLVDMLKSNWQVAQIVMGHRKGVRKSGFVRIPLQCSNRYALACLAIILTSTPGTAWVQYDRYSRVLLMHVLDLREGDDWQKIVHDRYERLLMEIFP